MKSNNWPNLEDRLMEKRITKDSGSTGKERSHSTLEEPLRTGARTMLQAAIESEVAEFINLHSNLEDEEGKRPGARNGYLPERNPACS